MRTRLYELASDGRIDMFKKAFTRISDAPLQGYGVGLPTGLKREGIHNLFLRSWYEGGILRFLGAISFYMTLVYYQLRSAYRAAFRPGVGDCPSPFTGSVYCQSSLCYAPMFRAQAASFTVMGWLCLAFFFGCLMANEEIDSYRSHPPGQ